MDKDDPLCRGKARLWDTNPVSEELTGNKLELVGPIMDGFLKEIGVSISFNFGRSSPIVILCRFQSFDAYAWVLVVGYGEGAEKNKNSEKIT